MTENVGTYITSNTLISKAKYNKILRFDSDDIMKENMVECMIEVMDTVGKAKIVLCYFETFPKKDGKSSKTGCMRFSYVKNLFILSMVDSCRGNVRQIQNSLPDLKVKTYT